MLELRPILSSMMRNKSGPMLIIIQLALTLAIVANCAFIINERLALMNRDSGTAESELITFSVLEMNADADHVQQRLQDVQALKALPGVIDATISNQVPLGGSGGSTSVWSNPEREGDNAIAGYYFGDHNLLHALGVTLIEGRNFTDSEVVLEPDGIPSKVLITQALARSLYPDRSAVGQLLYLQRYSAQIIGVVDTLQSPFPHRPGSYNNILIPKIQKEFYGRYVVRAQAHQRDQVMAQISDTMMAQSRDRVIVGLRDFSQARQRIYRNDLAMAKLLSTVIVLLVLITALGVVGLATYSVSQRRKQIGTRRALGATRAAIVRYFMVENGMLCLCGVGVGSALALGLNRYLMHSYELTALPGSYLLMAALMLLMMGQLAVAAPALKASRVSPALATRSV
ncbi:ABC transporter permease [Ferrimonas kyonanensis]|uniref:ABC transporter permease n=1 Tax=Ferrimonas kyonanensis TaxID=364763 RepID=UPI0003F7DC56|nr:FtsX-like permease family protein [Ferrimonas kyonanensis]